jgi:hypothetical protein
VFPVGSETLRDGRTVEIRAQRSQDREGMHAAIARSSSGSLYRRFFAVRREFSEKETDYFLDIDFVNPQLAGRSRRAEGIRGEEVFDRRELPDALGYHGRALIVELILVRLTILGVSFDLLAFESREMAANFIGRKHMPHFGDKSRKLPGERRMLGGGAGEVHQFLSDRIVERRLKPKALSDGSSRFALLDPNLMMIDHTQACSRYNPVERMLNILRHGALWQSFLVPGVRGDSASRRPGRGAAFPVPDSS